MSNSTFKSASPIVFCTLPNPVLTLSGSADTTPASGHPGCIKLQREKLITGETLVPLKWTVVLHGQSFGGDEEVIMVKEMRG